MIELRTYPRFDEILAMEQAARAARAAEMGRVAALAASKLKAITHRCATALSRSLNPASGTGDGNRHAEAPVTLASILEELAASLPEEMRKRHSQELLTAARVAPVIDLGIAAWEFLARIVAGMIHGTAQSLRAGAWCLDAAARRLLPLH